MALISSGKLFKWFDYFLILYFVYHAVTAQDSIISLITWLLAALVIWRRIYGKGFGNDTASFHLVDCEHRHPQKDGHKHHEGPLEKKFTPLGERRERRP